MLSNHQLVIANFEDKLNKFTRAVHGDFTVEDDFVIANTNFPTDTFNVLLPKSPTIQNSFELRHGISHFFIKNKFPFSTWIDARYLNDDWKKLMQEYGLKEAERNVMMKLDHTLHVEPRSSYGLKISHVEAHEELVKYEEVFMSLFQGTPEKEALQSYFNAFFSPADLGSSVRMFIGCIGEVAVTAGLLIESKNSYGIYDVMTKEAFRGNGYGSEMFHFLLNQTMDKQKPVVLQASEDGKNLYKRFGFIEVGEMVVFEKKY